jgi:hypothetical protein
MSLPKGKLKAGVAAHPFIPELNSNSVSQGQKLNKCQPRSNNK